MHCKACRLHRLPNVSNTDCNQKHRQGNITGPSEGSGPHSTKLYTIQTSRLPEQASLASQDLCPTHLAFARMCNYHCYKQTHAAKMGFMKQKTTSKMSKISSHCGRGKLCSHLTDSGKISPTMSQLMGPKLTCTYITARMLLSAHIPAELHIDDHINFNHALG